MNIRFTFLVKNIMLFLILFLLSKFDVKSQDIYKGKKEMPFTTYDEIPVYVIVEGIPSFYVDVIYTDNDLLYIDIYELFQQFYIACKIEGNGDILSGFVEDETKKYALNYNAGLITIGNRSFISEGGLFKEMGGYFMESKLFSDVFSIPLTFNYRSLSIVMKPSFELPAVKMQRMDKMRKNISKLKGEIIADTTVGRNYNLFKLGTFDWSFASAQTMGGPTYNRATAGIGAEVLYGEVNMTVNYYNRYKFDNRQLNYYWRWVDNERTFIKQAQVGRLYNNTISSILLPVVGASIRNTLTTIRKAEGFHTITDITEPNWIVELYINNSLVDYTVADASGLYTFKVPIVYGYTTLKFKFYGPLGEERTDERVIIMPYSFLPAKEFEYGLSSGVVLDSSFSKFSRAEVNYGLTSNITVGGGYEYLSSIQTGPHIPFVNFTFQPLRRVIINAEYADGVRQKAGLNYHLSRGSMLEFDYSKYVEGQKARHVNAPEERKIRLSLPYRFGSLVGYAKFDYAQMVFKEFTYNQNNLVLTANYRRFSINNTSQFNWLKNRDPYYMNETGLGIKMKKGLNLRFNTRYNMNEGRFVTFKSELEKKFYKAYLSASLERYFIYKQNFIGINFRYDLFFARTGFSVQQYNNNIVTAENISGSLAFDAHNNYMYLSNNSSLGKGGLLLYPFIDINNNGTYDKDEPLIGIERVKISGGRPEFIKKDTVIRIPDLNAFTPYYIELNNNDLDNIAWRFKDKHYKVIVDPNQFKRVDIPVEVLGEMNGNVMLENGTKKGIGRIIINIYDERNTFITQVLTEQDGMLHYLGLAPGNYTARLDTSQLNILNLTATETSINFTIEQDFYGDVVDGIDFILTIKDKTITDNIFLPDNGLNENVQEIIINVTIQENYTIDKIDEKITEKATTEERTELILRDSVVKEYYEKTSIYIDNLNKYYEKLNEYIDLLLKNIENNMMKLENEKE